MVCSLLAIQKVTHVLVCSVILLAGKHRTNILHKKWNKVQHAFEMLNAAFGESTMSKAKVYEWYKRFKQGPGNSTSSIEREGTSHCFLRFQ